MITYRSCVATLLAIVCTVAGKSASAASLSEYDSATLSEVSGIIRYKFVALDDELQQQLLATLKILYSPDPLEMPGLTAVALSVTKDDPVAQADLLILKKEALELTRLLAKDGETLAQIDALRRNRQRVRSAVDEAVQGFTGGRSFFNQVYQLASTPAAQQFLLVRYLYVQFAATQYPRENRSTSASRAIVVYKSNSAQAAVERLATGKPAGILFVEDVTRTVKEAIVREGLGRAQRKGQGCAGLTILQIPQSEREPWELRIPYDACGGPEKGESNAPDVFEEATRRRVENYEAQVRMEREDRDRKRIQSAPN